MDKLPTADRGHADGGPADIGPDDGTLPWAEQRPADADADADAGADYTAFVRVEGQNFTLAGDKWFPFGMNYWPSHFSQQVEPAGQGTWFDSPLYQENLALIEKDLDKMVELGFNAVWISAVFDRTSAASRANFVDFMARLARRELKVGLSLLGCNPFLPEYRSECPAIIAALQDTGVTADPNVFAYDLAWEITAGDSNRRSWLRRRWSSWLADSYGSLEAAGAAWGQPLAQTSCGVERDALVLSHDLPEQLVAGTTTSARITLLNSGSQPWQQSQQFTLGAVGDADPFAPSRVALAPGEVIAPGQSKTFELELLAGSTPGSYRSDWRMLQEGVTWFGEPLAQEVRVVAAGETIQRQVTLSATVACDPDDVTLCAPLDATTSAQRGLVVAYRRFIDDYANKELALVARALRQVAPSQLITVRMGYGGNGSRAVCPALPLDLRFSTAPLDFVSYETWSLPPGEVAQGGFIPNYAGSARPAINIEFGLSVCQQAADGSCAGSDPAKLSQQASYYDETYAMSVSSGTRGAFGWFFKGLRPMERSDFGIVEDTPSLEERPAAAVVRSWAAQMKALPDRTIDSWITVDRDAYAADWELYQTGWEAYSQAVAAGQTPGVRTPCTDTDSTVKHTVDGVLPKCLNGFFEVLQLQDASGGWIDVQDGAEVAVRQNMPIELRATLRNSGEATWRATGSLGGAKGTVRLGGNENYGAGFRLDLSADLPWRQTVSLGPAQISEGISSSQPLTVQLVAEDVSWFGERVDLTLVPVP